MSDNDESGTQEDQNQIDLDRENKYKDKELPFYFYLEYPFIWKKSDGPVTRIEVKRRLKAKDFKGIMPGEIAFDNMFKLISKMTGQHVAYIEEVDSKDMIGLTDIVNGFLLNGPKTGGD